MGRRKRKKVGNWEGEKVRLNQDRRQRTENGIRKSECGSGKERSRKSECGRGKRKKVGNWEGEIKTGQMTEDRGQRSDDRGQRTEDRGQRTEENRKLLVIGWRKS